MLAIASTVAALALIGATSAMATSTQACKKDTTNAAPTAMECERALSAHFANVGHFKLVMKAPIFGTVTVECNVLLQATLPNALASPLTTTAATLTYSNCLSGCGVTVIKNGSVSTLALKNVLSEEKSDVTWTNFELLTECMGLHCFYKAEALEGKGLGPLLTASGFDEVTYTNAIWKKVAGTGAFCPDDMTLTGVFRDLTKIYLRE